MVQSESATLLDVAAALKGLRLKIQNWNVHDAFGITERKAEKFKDDAMSVIHRRELSFIRAQDHHALRSAEIVCDAHHMDWGPGEYKEALKWIKEWGADLIQLYPNKFSLACRTLDRQGIMNRLGDQITDFQHGINEFAEKNNELHMLEIPVSRGSFEYDETKGDDEQQKITNWVRFWQQQTDVDLGNIASVLLSMGVSETQEY